MNGIAGVDATAAGQSTCPTEAARTRNNVVRFLTGASWLGERQQLGIPALSAGDVVLLSDPADAAVCQRIAAMIGPVQNARFPHVFSYYRAGNLYFVAFTPVVPDGRIWTGFSPLVVLRSDFTYLETFGM